MGIILRQGIKNYFITYFGVTIGFLSVIFIQPRILSPEELGLSRLLFSVAMLFANIYPLGLNIFTTKYFPYFKDKEKGHHGFPGFLILMSTVLFIAGSIIFYFFKPVFLSKYANSPMFVEYFNYIFPFSYFIGIFTILSAYSYSLFKTTIPSFLNEVVFRIWFILILVLFSLKFIDLNLFIILYISSYALAIPFLLIYFYKTDKLKLKINWEAFQLIPRREAFRFTLLIWLTGLAGVALKNIDAVFIGSYLSLKDVAIYTISLTIASMIEVPVNGISKIVIPKISEAFKDNDWGYIKKTYYQCNRLTIVAGSFLFLQVFLNAHEILALLPQKYREGELVLKIIALGSLVNISTSINFNILQYSQKYGFAAGALILLALLSAISNIFLIPRFGLPGAAIGTALSVVIINIFIFLFLLINFKLQPFRKTDLIFLGTTILLIGISLFLPVFRHPHYTLIVKAGIISLMYLILIINTDIKAELENLFRKPGKKNI